ncbi:lactonase family protein [Halomonas sp. HNIBRBA4712]|uniref:lactonase family protein n=1 Tax=Halomonas sp. HNIBRBA4712 TaxID=3373087 RepID=UPI0037471DDF
MIEKEKTTIESTHHDALNVPAVESRRRFLTASGVLLGSAAFGGLFSGMITKASASTTHSASGGQRSLFAYIGSRTTLQRKAEGKGIEVYRFDPESGDFHHVQQVSGLDNPSYLIVHPNQRLLYTVHGDIDQVSAYAIDQQSGELSLINSENCGGTNPVYLTLTPDNQCLLVANYATGSVGLHSINQDGSIGTLIDLLEFSGEPGPHRTQQKGSHPHQVQYDPSHQWVIVPDKGLDKIFTLRLDVKHNRLSIAQEITTRSGAGPRHAAFHPANAYCYIINELDSTIAVYDFEVETGQLTPKQVITTLPQDYTANNTGSAILVSGDGRFVYCSNRGHDSIAVFEIDQTTGLLSHSSWHSTQGQGPRFATFDPTGKWLLAANELTHTLLSFEVSTQSGGLLPHAPLIETGSPVSIAFAAL